MRRIKSRRRNIRTIYSDNGSNIIRADNELKRAFEGMDDEKIQAFMQEFGGDWIKWKRNPPAASQMDDVWERQIRSARRILSSLLQTHGKAFLQLSPANILTMKSKVVMPPPGEFSKPDLYCRKRWRCVQHVINEFWF